MATATLAVELELLGLRERARRISERIKKLSEHLCTEQVELEEVITMYNRMRARLPQGSIDECRIKKEGNFPPLGIGNNGELLVHKNG